MILIGGEEEEWEGFSQEDQRMSMEGATVGLGMGMECMGGERGCMERKIEVVVMPICMGSNEWSLRIKFMFVCVL